MNIINGDLFVELPKIDDKFDVIITDPPYGMSIKNCTGHSKKDNKILNWDSPDFDYDLFFKLLFEKMHDKSIMYVFGNHYCLNKYPTPKKILIWDKKDYDVGNLKGWSVSYEFICIYGYESLTFNKRPKGILNFVKPQNFASSEYKNSMDGNAMLHPTQKPLALIDYILSHHRDKKTLLDPCAGSGTVLISAYKNNFQFVGIEKDKNYYSIIEKRLENTQKQTFL